MFRIRARQIEGLGNARLEQFAKRMEAHMRTRFSDQLAADGVVGDDDLGAFVRQGIARAQTSGIHSEQDCQSFLEMMATLGRNFDEDERYPWAKRILSSDATGAVKIDRLNEHLLFGLGEPK